MGLETSTYVNGLNVNNPASTDGLAQADDHLRLIKSTLTATFPNLNAAVTAAPSELNVLDGITATTAELNYTDGVTSNIQTQLNTKAPLASPTFTGTATIPTANITTVDLGDWTIVQSGSDLKFVYQGTARFKLSSAGALTVENDITAFGSA